MRELKKGATVELELSQTPPTHALQAAATKVQARVRGNAGRKAAIEERIERMMAFEEAGGDETER